MYPEFIYSPAIPYEPGVTRRDPSPVIRADDQYHVWYSRATADASGYFATIWYATSPDGHQWTEQTQAIGTGEAGDWDEHAVFTPTIFVFEGTYYIVYTAVPAPFTNDDGGPNGTPTALGIARSSSPAGPWRKPDCNPILRPGAIGDFDSHRTDDACVVVREGRIWLYYKGREKGLSPGETKMGLAMADRPEGPYRKSPDNPVLGSGHEVCVWPHGDGVAAIVAPCGPEGGTLQYSPDGLRFVRQSKIAPPKAPGPFRTDGFGSGRGPGIAWGISHDASEDRPFLVRFDCDLRVEPGMEQEPF